jgi:hypothetical protein
VAQYVDSMIQEVGIIAHSCGVDEPRKLRRQHARIVQPSGGAILLSDLYASADYHSDNDYRR